MQAIQFVSSPTVPVASEDLTGSPVLWVILGCEIGFWVLVIVGLGVRYLLHRRGLSQVVLWSVPVLDVVLLSAVAVDLQSGAEVTTIHRIAGIYLGVTIAFGHSMIRWADVRFAHRFANGPKPSKPPKRGMPALRYETRTFAQWLLAAAIAAAAILLLEATVADDRQRAALDGVFPMLGVVTVIWLVTGPVWALFTASDD
ncbi:hypothetical protein Gbro_0185 [Gordonia bronchialis DSM 43247]|uniref:Uncharacterized protein n=1 Tax=Gordonia bronchialis (strain ATCC 25592 / DSM 43247 / BCRC 13721 / JCM 3198 / KCTC 3076 / NBRC 16047 / NCTC 10667) TaxID=526226 RepID=D0LBA2_GORB4|nr:hypothetical protein [Gordonia bronchialis]ACY19533.1 hypothetical protein Gbro_0185 [Gordonia bronchialis DSM 43247]MCC3322312.1 hypothetical protein [Gordonia bronchialis]QGS26545.1 hypothetical protein FOB84_22915 [Gordonia bronchialis]STQ62291.1 Uncharacterised protein [Gordonia bronchialis]